MAVHIEKKYWYGWKSVASVSYKNDARGKVSYHKISADGTYRLRFISDPTAYSFHVWGTFNK
ncbi:hypothetical protein DSM100238_0633 [Bifidobacterium apri]|uniref:Uncharacterized protein n=1 Tax=Bifidobacterium apri TaxID=1769423 RepID=A0A6A2VFS8_9BIFI|nr:hypothetical protein DSM100238_0633 [Bifidobacterium apri]